MSSRRSRSGAILKGITLRRKYRVGAEAARRYFAAELAVGCRDDAHVDLARLRRADAKYLAVFEHAEQLGLEIRAGLSDFVEKERAARGPLEASRTFADCSGERALLMPEQLAFDHALAERFAIDCDERAVGAVAPVMKHPGDHFLAGPSLAFDKDRGPRRRHPANHRDQLAALRPLGDEAGRDAGDVELLAEFAVLALQGAHLDRAADDRIELVGVERLGDVVERPALKRRLGRPRR